MEYIFFPGQYKKALVHKTKNSTIRIGNEIGKYKIGNTYNAKSYAGRLWNIKIKIISISVTTVNRLDDFGIPKRSIEAILKKEKIDSTEKVELIKFEVV